MDSGSPFNRGSSRSGASIIGSHLIEQWFWETELELDRGMRQLDVAGLLTEVSPQV